jgi:hypothetical protein
MAPSVFLGCGRLVGMSVAHAAKNMAWLRGERVEQAVAEFTARRRERRRGPTLDEVSDAIDVDVGDGRRG